MHAPAFLAAACVYAVLLVYASLVPFELRPRSLDSAWQEFQQIPFLVLGPESRADWIANLVAYAPLAFLIAAAPGRSASAPGRAAAAVAAVVLCLALAVVVEFVQIFFAPRTVSLNDLMAEVLGSVAGALAGWVAAPRSAAIVGVLSRGGRPALRVAAGVYSLAYVALALFPYDFVIAGDELQAKLAAAGRQLWVLPGAERSLVHAAGALGFSVLAMMPVGALVAHTAVRGGILRALMMGLAVGAVIEGLQALILSGVSDVASILARGAGAFLGAVTLAVLRRADLPSLRRRFRPVAPLVALPYLLALAAVNDLVGGGWLDASSAAAKLAKVSFIPFYYHYFTTEAVAFASVVSRVAMYLPVGGLLWLWQDPRRTSQHVMPNAAMAALLAAVLAAACEAARLFKPDLRPDPTNVLIAAAAAGATYALLTLGWRWLVRPTEAARHSAPASVPSGRPQTPHHTEHTSLRPPPDLGKRIAVAAGPALAAVLGVAGFPLAPFWLALGLAAYAAVLWRWPSAWLVLLPALLPAFDLTPWSGRFFFDEADFLILVTAAVVYIRHPPRWRDWRLHGGAGALVILLAVAQLVAMLRGLMPLAPIGDNAFNNHFSTYNALRIGKGLGWALLLLPALAHACRRDLTEAVGRIGLGAMLGLAAVVLVSLRERHIFTGLFDFETPFRVTATFSSMHLGGGSIGAFLAMTLPFLALPFVLRAGLALRIAAVVVLAGAAYTLLVTFNRAAYLGAVVAFLVLLIALPAAYARRTRARLGLSAGLAAAAIALAVAAGYALPGSFAAERFDRVGEDLETRLWQWREGLALAEPGLGARLFGTGLGSYPRSFLLRNEAGRVPTTFAVARDGGRVHLRLGSGENLYFGQRIGLRPHTTYRLSVTLRSEAADARLMVAICEKTLLYSFECQFLSFEPDQPGVWEDHELEVRSGEMGRPAGLIGWLSGRPVELALYNPVHGTTVDIDTVSIAAETGPAAGQQLLVNGDFEAGTDRWFYAADNLAIWRIENMWLMTLFEQGWLGLVGLALVVVAALLALVRRIAGGLPEEAGAAAVLLASLSGFLVVGLAHGLLDAPRLATLFYLLLILALCLARPAPLPGAPVRHGS